MYCGHCGVDIEHLKDRSQGEQIKALITCRNKVSAKLAERDAEIERLLKRFDEILTYCRERASQTGDIVHVRMLINSLAALPAPTEKK